MNTTLEELARLMELPEEFENLEFKAAESGLHSTRIYKYCVALSNEGGGRLVLGVTDKLPRRVVGTNGAASPTGMQKKIFDTLHFLVRVEEVRHPDGRVVVFHIPGRPIGLPHHWEGSYWMRSGEDLVPMSPERLREIIEEGKPDWLLRTAREACSASDVIQLLDTQVYYDLLKQLYPTRRAAVLERLEQERLIFEDGRGYSITNLGAVLFAKRLDVFDGLERKAHRVIVYDGPHKLEKHRVFQPGSKGYAVGFLRLIDFINSHVPSNEVVGRALREEVKMFPEIAIRELVANALIHQDFSETGTSVTVEIYSDRLEVSNPGKPLISTDRFADEYQSRNETLAGLMRRLGMCEEQGLGIDRVINSTEVFQLPLQIFVLGKGTLWQSFMPSKSSKRWIEKKGYEPAFGIVFFDM